MNSRRQKNYELLQQFAHATSNHMLRAIDAKTQGTNVALAQAIIDEAQKIRQDLAIVKPEDSYLFDKGNPFEVDSVVIENEADWSAFNQAFSNASIEALQEAFAHQFTGNVSEDHRRELFLDDAVRAARIITSDLKLINSEIAKRELPALVVA